MSDDVLVYVTYGSQADDCIPLIFGHGYAKNLTISSDRPDIEYCDGVLAITNAGTDALFADDLRRAYKLNKQVFVAGTGQIPPNLIRQDLVMETRKLRVFEALRKLADAMCELREVCNGNVQEEKA